MCWEHFFPHITLWLHNVSLHCSNKVGRGKENQMADKNYKPILGNTDWRNGLRGISWHSTRGSLVAGQEAISQTEMQEVSSEHQKTLIFLCRWLDNDTGCLESLWSFLSWRHSEVTWIWGWACSSKWSCWHRLDHMGSGNPFQSQLFHDSENSFHSSCH